MPLSRDFYERSAPEVARDLLGCLLTSRRGGTVTTGRIVETEAYLGPEDGASHAASRPSARALFYGPGGRAYVFRAYGRHLCLNAIAGPPGTPGCVLIRAVEPVAGETAMARRRARPAGRPGLTDGPGRLTQALGITLRDSGSDLTRDGRVIVSAAAPPGSPVAVGRRIGITRSPELPLRFWIRGSPYVSRRGAR